MKTKIKMICCALIGSAAILMTAKVYAQTSDSDKQFLAKAAQSDVNEIKLSQLAEEKASNPAVKAFAQKMVAEHKKLSASMKPFADSWASLHQRTWMTTTSRSIRSSMVSQAQTLTKNTWIRW